MTAADLANAFAALAEHQSGEPIMSANRIAHIAARVIDGEPWRSEVDWQNLVASHEALRAALSRAEAERDAAKLCFSDYDKWRKRLFHEAYENAAQTCEEHAREYISKPCQMAADAIREIALKWHGPRLSRTD